MTQCVAELMEFLNFDQIFLGNPWEAAPC